MNIIIFLPIFYHYIVNVVCTLQSGGDRRRTARTAKPAQDRCSITVRFISDMNSQKGGTLGEASDVELRNESFSPVSRTRSGRKFVNPDEPSPQKPSSSTQKPAAEPSMSAVKEEPSSSLDSTILQMLRE